MGVQRMIMTVWSSASSSLSSAAVQRAAAQTHTTTQHTNTDLNQDGRRVFTPSHGTTLKYPDTSCHLVLVTSFGVREEQPNTLI